MSTDDWMIPDWSQEGWQRKVPEFVRAMWSELLPTHKWKLRQWAEDLLAEEEDAILEAKARGEYDG